jgi:ubiquitin domain-containing protein
LKAEVHKLTEIPPQRQQLTYDGIELQDDKTLRHYHIVMRSVVRCHLIATKSFLHQSDEIKTELISEKLSEKLSEEPFYSADETETRMFYLKENARNSSNPNVDLHITDPITYYSFLNHLERSLVSASEYFRCHGKYNLADNIYRQMTPETQTQLRLVPDPMWRIHSELLTEPSLELSGREESNTRTLRSLWKSYLIICQVLTSFNALKDFSFSTTFYSILIKRPSTNIAELIRIPPERIDGLKTGIESAITRIADADIESEPTDVELSECIALPCDYLLGIMKLRLTNTIPYTRVSILTMCRITALILDLALVSYVGSHGSPFNVFVNSTAESIEVPNEQEDLNSFRCTLMPLACLDGFLNHSKVWAFEIYSGKIGDQVHQNVDEKLLILTGIEEFADVWGPVWTVPAGKNHPDLVLRYNVSKGCIKPVKGLVKARFEDSVACHWEEQSSSDEPNNILLSKTDRLLIGVSLRANNACTYTLGDFERDYHTSMRPLDTSPPSWYLESRTAGLGFQQYVGGNISGTQKRLPGRTVKEGILARFAQNSDDADISWLQSFWGIEISHCTGNARRIKMKDLFLLPPVLHRLQRYKRGWERLPWGQLLFQALGSDNPQDLRDAWEGNPQMQSEMAKLLYTMLKLLHHTGNRDQHLVSAFFSDAEDRRLEYKVSNSDWAKSLQDSDMKAAYIVISGTCLKYREGYQAAQQVPAICTYGHRSRTVFKTKLEFKSTPIQDYVQLYPGKKQQRKADLHGHRITLVPDNNVIMKLTPMSTATEILIPPQYADPNKQYSALIRSSASSYGGMDENHREPHRQVQPQRNQPQQNQPQQNQPQQNQPQQNQPQPRSPQHTRSQTPSGEPSQSQTRPSRQNQRQSRSQRRSSRPRSSSPPHPVRSSNNSHSRGRNEHRHHHHHSSPHRNGHHHNRNHPPPRQKCPRCRCVVL